MAPGDGAAVIQGADFLDQIPEGLTKDLRSYGPQTWPDVQHILGIAA